MAEVETVIALKLLNLKISDCTSEGELKSVFKEVTTRNDSEDYLDVIVASIKSQLCFSSDERKRTQEINNVLTFIKSLAETQPQFGAQKFDELVLKNENDNNESKNGTEMLPLSPSSIPSDFIYDFIIKPLLCQLWDHIILILNDHCKSWILSLSTTKGPATLSTHELLSLIHKLVRTSLTLLKRIELTNENVLAINTELMTRLNTFGESLCDLLEYRNFELSLDIKCNIGLSLCYILKILKIDETSSTSTSFLESIFSKNPTPKVENGLRRRILESSLENVNRIGLAFGVLGTMSVKDTNFKCIMQTIGENILNIDHGTKEATNLGSARVLELWTDKLSNVEREILKEFSPLFIDLEFFIFSYLPGHIDAVKTCCRYMIGSLARIYDRMEDINSSYLVMELLKKVLAKPLHIKWIGISCIARNTPKAIDIMNIQDGLPEIFLCCQRTSTNPCSDSYLSLMTQQFSKVPEPEWEKNWIDPLFRNQQSHNGESNWPQKRAIMTSILKGRNERIKEAILRSVVRRMNSSLVLCNESSLLAVEAIKIASDLEIKMDRQEIDIRDTNSFRNIILRERLHSWLLSGNPQIRLAGFSLLVETKKTSEIIPLADFESLKLVFRYSFTSQNPAFRQQFLSYFKKLLKRLRDSQKLVIRNRDEENAKYYKEFLHWLWKFLTIDEGLFPGSNFGRRCQALECLAELINHFDMNSLGVTPCVENLSHIQWLYDTYEYNKVKALQILSKIPMPSLENDTESQNASDILNTAFELCESVKPPNSLTGRYLITFLISKCHHVDQDKYSPWSLLCKIYDKLSEIFDKIVESTLIEVAADTPMYGHIRCIRMIFNETREYLVHWERYRNYSKKLINLCLQLDEILFPVLGSAAPEGFLPGLPDSQPQNSQVVRSINAQMLLVCSWRSMKDICLLLTEMCVLFPLEGESENYILSYDQVVLIGEHLLYLLKNLMHRGVFEQVYIGFRQLAGRLFKSSSQRLNKLPETWLNSAMDEELVNSKCITRRSAGLPFIFQALLSPVSSNETFISKYVTRLFTLDSTSSPSVRIHTMNVLRGLFRDANFSRAMMPYVPLGLQLAFKGLKASNWTERNSGLMLFGAVIRRTFGPKLNLMSAPTFFRKFPQMYDFLLEEIQTCCVGLESKGYLAMSDFTYYVLLLLSSFAANGVVEDKHFQLIDFISPIRECGSSADCQVRKIAAKALIPFLIDPVDKVKIILVILDDLATDNIHGANRIHGNLVQIRTILGTISSESNRNDIIVQFNDFISRSSVWSSDCPMIFEVILDICMILGEGTVLSYRVIKSSYEVSFGRGTGNRRSVPGLPFADMKISAAEVFFVLSDDMTNNFTECVYNWMQTENIVFIEELLIYLCEQIDKCVERTEEEMSLVLFSIVKRYLKENFTIYCQSPVKEKFLEVMSKIPIEAFKDWANFVDEEDFLYLFESLLAICEMDGGTMESKCFSLTVLGNMALKIKNDFLDNENYEQFFELLTQFCDSKLDDDIRLAAAKCIPKFSIRKLNVFSVLQRMKLWYVLLILAQDDESSVRIEIGRKISNENTEVCERRSLEIIVNLFLNEFVSEYIIEGLVLLVGLLLRDDFEIRAMEADDGEEDRLFDKSEMNSFNEPVLLGKILLGELENHLELKDRMKTHFLNSHLNVDLQDFFVFVSNSTLPYRPDQEILTLPSLCEIVSMKLTSYVDVQSCTSLSSLSIPSPSSEKHFVLKWIRKFVLSVLS